MDDVKLVKERSTDGQWYRYKDPRPLKTREAQGSRTWRGIWIYEPNEALEIRFEAMPERGWAIWLDNRRIDFSPEIAPETELGDSIRAAKRKAISLLPTPQKAE